MKSPLPKTAAASVALLLAVPAPAEPNRVAVPAHVEDNDVIVET